MPEPRVERTMELTDLWQLAEENESLATVMGAIVQGAALAVQEDEYVQKLAEVTARIEAAKADDENADVSALEAEKQTLQSGLDAVRQKMGPVN